MPDAIERYLTQVADENIANGIMRYLKSAANRGLICRQAATVVYRDQKLYVTCRRDKTLNKIYVVTQAYREAFTAGYEVGRLAEALS